MNTHRKKEEHEYFLDLNAAVQGKMVFAEAVNLRIGGRFEGELTAKGNLVIAKTADVRADIICENIIIEGHLSGKVHASKELVLAHNCNVHADIEAMRFSVEPGAIFNGSCRMLSRKMSVGELCEYLSVEEEKLLKWVHTGQIPSQKTGGEIVFDHKEVEGWLAQHA